MKSLTLLGLAAMAFDVFARPTASSLDSTVTTQSGTIMGNPRDSSGILNFKAIPYAAPPVGDLRWSSPKAPTNFSGTLNATAFGASCYASITNEVPYFTEPSENCLFLNVWTGATQATEKRPVMVFIPGGGFQFGSSAQPTYDGTALARDGVVVVTINYRLGVFGYLALTELDGEGSNSGNFGLQDQIAALTWVKNSIAAFGGDPTQVTVFGQSAGAHAIGMLMTSSLTTGLFSKAILESGALWDSPAGPVTSYDTARSNGAAFQAALGAKSVAQLRSMSASTINSADQSSALSDPKLKGFSPSIDFYVLKQQPGMAFADGLQHKIPVLGGITADEQAIFLTYGLSETNATKFEDGLKLYFNYREPQALALYPDSTPALLQNSSQALVGDMVIREQTYTVINYQHSARDVPANSVFAYYFTYTSPYSPEAIHTAELPFVFGTLGPNPLFGPGEGPPTAQDMAFSRNLTSYWTNFVKTGDPNGVGVPEWPVYTGSGTNFIQLGTTIVPYNYNVSRFQYLASFRTDGVWPTSWAAINVTAIN